VPSMPPSTESRCDPGLRPGTEKHS
jgi:hypothetical protein